MHFVGSPKVSFVQEFALCKQLEQSLPLTLKWSTDQSWTWKQGLTNASLLVGGTLSKNSWQWANLLWTNSAKTALYFQINAPLYCSAVFKGKICLKMPENWHGCSNNSKILPELLSDSYRLSQCPGSKEIAMHHFFGTPCTLDNCTQCVHCGWRELDSAERTPLPSSLCAQCNCTMHNALCAHWDLLLCAPAAWVCWPEQAAY